MFCVGPKSAERTTEHRAVSVERAIRNDRDGDGYDADGDRTQTAEALPRIIRELRERGYSFVRLPA